MLYKAHTTLIVFIAFIYIALSSVSALAEPATDPIASEITTLTNNIDSGQVEISKINSQLEVTTKEILRTYQQLDNQEYSLRQQQRSLNSRFQEVYKNYNDFLLTMLVDIQDFNDLWKRLSFMAKVNEADAKLLATNKVRLEQISDLKKNLAQKKQTQIELRMAKQIEYQQLQTALLQKKSLLEKR